MMNEVYDPYMKRRLLDMALGRKKASTLKITNNNVEDIEKVHEFLFKVKSESKREEVYNVDMEIGICDCPSGQTGAICKHQVACAKKYLLQLPQQFKSTPASRQWLAGVALGKDNIPSLDFFSDLKDNSSHAVFKEDSACVIPKTEQPENNNDDFIVNPIVENSDDDFIDENKPENKPPINAQINYNKASGKLSEEKIQEFVDYFKEKAREYGDGNSEQAIDRAMKMGDKNCKSSNYFNSAVTTMFSQSTSKVSGGRGNIHCQPTSVARRKPGVPRGVAPVGKGRKRKGNLLEKAAKRKNNLTLNISQNVPNAKKH